MFKNVASIVLVCLLSTTWLSGTSAQQLVPLPVSEELRTGFESISAEQSNQWLNVLASPAFEGRGTGQVGYAKAAHWVAGKCAEYGLEPMGTGGSYFQMLPMSRNVADLEESKIEGPNGLVISGPGKLGFQRFTEQPMVSGSVVFVSVATEEPQLPADVSLRDKIVVLKSEVASDFRTQVMLARAQPAGVVTVVKGVPDNIAEVTRGRNRSAGIWSSINEDTAQTLVEALGADPTWLQPSSEKGVVVNESDAKLTISVRLREEKLFVPNVVAWLEGSDPNLRHEHIVLGAHLDHLGVRGSEIYNGADDNGSGSTAILNVARAMGLNSVRPKRSVMFIWFAAEEIGLVGSRHYVDNPTQPLENIVCMINCDMVGRDEETRTETAESNVNTVHLVGSKRGQTALHDLIIDANQHVNLEFKYGQEGVFGRSDQASFYQKGIPVAFFFSGFHPDYHQPSDEPELINYEKIASVARLCYLTIFKIDEYGRIKLSAE
ncbi:MAG TPA: M20/M25/M40 family metallo-hydrolase [Pirellulaceae bacterium]|nr:M20/M25/M40 family metallo-hydrolase [Pirellulaceae bacterium]HMO92949.1 M20/M25/M40 family metallo-hydrolase [Pirellulaceae bacterium]HMP68486.1 M20/M25/M40 family metallo-hydrolase [Pirellulaceae bacterium]